MEQPTKQNKAVKKKHIFLFLGITKNKEEIKAIHKTNSLRKSKVLEQINSKLKKELNINFSFLESYKVFKVSNSDKEKFNSTIYH